jgi:Gpi18-like mannosyltransferase
MVLHKIRQIASEPVYQIAFGIFVMLSFYTSHLYLPYDRNGFQTWCVYIFENGIAQSYHCPEPEMNYPPLMSYILWLFGKIQGSSQEIIDNFHYFKITGLIFDVLGALVVLKYLKNHTSKITFLLLMLANPFFVFNSYLWGQVDSILGFAAFSIFYFLNRKNLQAASFMLLLIANIKPQVIIFFPPFFLYALYSFHKELRLKDVIISVLACLTIQLLILLPFIINNEMQGVINVYLKAVGFHPKVSISAFNVWVLLLGEQCLYLSDEIKSGIFTYKQIGLMMFCASSAVALMPLFLATVSKLIKKIVFRIDDEIVLLSFSLIPLRFVFFNTQMHERYSHPALLFIAAFSFMTNRKYLFLFFSFVYFCNLEPRLYGLGLHNYEILIFNPYFVASSYLLLIGGLYFLLYNRYIALNRH